MRRGVKLEKRGKRGMESKERRTRLKERVIDRL
jgi:hypothetical protein